MRGLVGFSGSGFELIQVGVDFLAQLDQVGPQLFEFGLRDSFSYGRGEFGFFLHTNAGMTWRVDAGDQNLDFEAPPGWVPKCPWCPTRTLRGGRGRSI